jgi:hypothetical protein
MRKTRTGRTLFAAKRRKTHKTLTGERREEKVGNSVLCVEIKIKNRIKIKRRLGAETTLAFSV